MRTLLSLSWNAVPQKVNRVCPGTCPVPGTCL